MFDRSADLYDAFYDVLGKNYRTEARTVLRLAGGGRRGYRPQSLLDVACGTGRHLVEFGVRVPRCAGVDLDPAMLAIARRRCPDARLEVADMVDFDLGEQYDVVTCLFSSIGYVGSVSRLRRTVAAMARHLTPEGVLLVEPWFEPDRWLDGYTSILTVEEADRKAARVSRASRRRNVAVLDFEYLVAEPRSIRHLTERHELTLFTWPQYLDAFARAGLDVEIDDYGVFGRGLFIGRPR